jgi:hypothetical protein
MSGLGLLFLFAALYWSGLLMSGWERRTIVWIPPSTFRNSGPRIGSRTVFARAGESIQVDYQAEIRRGGLHIRIWRDRIGVRTVPVGAAQVHWSNQGTLIVPIRETGFYRIDCDGFPATPGFDISYEISWRVK